MNNKEYLLNELSNHLGLEVSLSNKGTCSEQGDEVQILSNALRQLKKLDSQPSQLIKDQYRAIGVNVAHLSESDKALLSKQSMSEVFGMVAERYNGWFFKIYDDVLSRELYDEYSDSFFSIVQFAYTNGFSLIEFDSDALEYDQFKTYD